MIEEMEVVTSERAYSSWRASRYLQPDDYNQRAFREITLPPTHRCCFTCYVVMLCISMSTYIDIYTYTYMYNISVYGCLKYDVMNKGREAPRDRNHGPVCGYLRNCLTNTDPIPEYTHDRAPIIRFPKGCF